LDLSGLQNLLLQSLPRIASVPFLGNCTGLRRIVLDNMRGLRDLSALEAPPALEEFLLLQGGACQPKQLAPVLRNPNVVRVGAFFGSEKRNRAFAAMAEASGNSRFDWYPFGYR
jgi:hypothetical protein